MQCIVLEGMQSDNFTGVVKLHKKGITAEGAKPAYYSGRTYPFEEVELPSNVTLLDDPDLTYSRHSADIIIIDRATSTIGWALASKAVVVYVSIASSPLEEEIFEILDDSIFLIDASREGWVEDLKRILNTDSIALLDQWKQKEAKREKFIENYLLGHRGLTRFKTSNFR